jgi:hypothetical protein
MPHNKAVATIQRLAAFGRVIRAAVRQQWVEMTHPRVAAYWHRAFNAGFLTMNPKARPSQPDPLLSFDCSDVRPESSRSTCWPDAPVPVVGCIARQFDWQV